MSEKKKNGEAQMFREEEPERNTFDGRRIRTRRMFEEDQPRNEQERRKRKRQNTLMLAIVILLLILLITAKFLQRFHVIH
jgi:hypothetical protein